MINHKNALLSDSDFIDKYIATMKKKICKNLKSHQVVIKNTNFGVFQPIEIDEFFLKKILVNPFLNSEGTGSDNLGNFIESYLKIKDYLLKGEKYFNILKRKAQEESTPTKERNLYYKKIRKSAISDINLILESKIDLESVKSEKEYLKQHKEIREKFREFNLQLKIEEILPYGYLDKELRLNILERINIPICPYCNRQYINVYKKNNKSEVIAQLDHFYPKSIFPLFSLTLANFIPSCAYCNTILKRDYLFPLIHPYNFNDNNCKIFEYELNEFKSHYGVNDIQIRINKENIFYDQVHFFNIQEIYENHRSNIVDLINKKKLLNASYKKSMEQALQYKLSDEQFKIMLFETTGSDNELSNSPLAKLKKDILDL